MRMFQGWMWSVLAVAAALLVIGLLAGGCSAFRSTQEGVQVSPTDRTPIAVNADTVRLLTDEGVTDAKILAEALSAVQDQGSVVYVDHKGWVFGPDGNLLLVDGKPLAVRTQMVAKLNSLHGIEGLQGVGKLTYEVGGFPHIDRVPPQLQGAVLANAPTLLYLNVEEVQAAKVTSPTPAIIQARTAEREAIFAGLAAVVRERFVGKEKAIRAVADGLTEVVVAGGQVAVGVLKQLNPITAASGEVAGMLATLADPATGKQAVVEVR